VRLNVVPVIPVIAASDRTVPSITTITIAIHPGSSALLFIIVFLMSIAYSLTG
jgi:hypothetical protein